MPARGSTLRRLAAVKTGQEPPSLVAEDRDGRELSLSLGWDPRDPPSIDRPEGDFVGVLAALEERLAAEGELSELLGAKVLTLVQLGQPEERILDVADRFLEVTAAQGEDVPALLALSRLLVAQTLDTGSRCSESAQALSDVASFYGTDDDPHIRSVAAWALQNRFYCLVQLGDLDGVGAAWESVRDQYGGETHPAIRTAVARAGRRAAVAFWNADRAADALRTSEEVIGAYRSDPEADIRADTVAAMIVRYSSLRRRRLVARWRALTELVHFVGSNPEPEVVEAIRATHPESADWLLRRAHDPH